MAERRFWKAFGPGLLFAGTAIGASHLVQSTRAGAIYGLALVWLIVAANLIKYPAFTFGPRYAAATGRSLLEGYRRQGRWALILYALVTVGVMFAVQAALAIVAAGLLQAIFELELGVLWIALALMGGCAALLVVGRYRWLDRVNKLAVAILTVSTLICAIAAVPRLDLGGPWWPEAGFFGDPRQLFFLLAVVGWMPTALDVSVWHSLWTLARSRDTEHRPSVREAQLDFDIGYVGTALLALCFVVMGAVVMQGQTIPGSAGEFAAMVIHLYTATLGDWTFPVIGASAFLTMFSSLLAVVDAFPRVLATLVARFSAPEREGEDPVRARPRLYWGSMLVVAGGAFFLLRQMPARLPELVDLATTISVVTAPVFAFLNHRAISSRDLSPELRPGRPMLWASLVCMLIMLGLAGLYVWVRLVA